MRILKRPMFKKGGSANSGIMNGLVDRKGYAQGSYVPRVGYEDGSWLNKIRGLYSSIGKGIRGPGFTMSTPYTGTNLPALYSKPPLISERGLWEAGKKIAGKGAGIVSGFAKRFPKIGVPAATLAAAEYVTSPTNWEEEMDIGRWDKIGRDLIPYFGTKKKLEQYEKWKKGKEFEPFKRESIPPGEKGGPGYVPPETEGTGGLEISDADTKAVLADKRSILSKRAKEFAELMSPHATKRLIADVAGATSESFAGSTGDTRQDIVNAITAAAKASGGQRKTYDKAMELAIMEDIQKGLKTNKVSETDKLFAKYQIANPQEEGESDSDYYKRLLKKMSTGKIPIETKLDFEKAYTNMGETKEDGRIAWAKRTYGGHNDFGGILDPDNMPEQVQGKKYYDPDADNWKDHKSEITTPPGE